MAKEMARRGSLGGQAKLPDPGLVLQITQTVRTGRASSSSGLGWIVGWASRGLPSPQMPGNGLRSGPNLKRFELSRTTTVTGRLIELGPICTSRCLLEDDGR